MADKETEATPFPYVSPDLFSEAQLDPVTGQRYSMFPRLRWPWVDPAAEFSKPWFSGNQFDPVTGRRYSMLPQWQRPWFDPATELPTPSFQERLLKSLDSIYRAPEFTDRVMLPGLVDHLLSDEPEKELQGLLDGAPEYASRQIFQLCSQSPEFDGLIADHFEDTGTSYIMKTSGIDPLIVKFAGFKETDPVEDYISLPVLSFSFPADECSLDFSPEVIAGNEASFKIDIPGFAGGAGIRRKIALGSNTKALKENIQGHVRADIRLRRFVRNEARLALIEITDVSSNVYAVGEESQAYWPLPEPEEKFFQERLGVDSKKAEDTSSSIVVQQGDWADFSLALTPDIFSALTSIEVPEGLRLELHLRSESESSFKFVLHCPVGKLYDLLGANGNSLRLFVEQAT